MAREDIRHLGIVLRDSQFETLSPGEFKLSQIYAWVEESWSDLCDNQFMCADNCKSGHKN